MYHKIIGGRADRKQRNIKHSISYLLRKNKPEEQQYVKTLSMTTEQDLLNFNTFILPKGKKSPYVAGVLSFEEESINEDIKCKIIIDFEEVLFAGIEPENRPPLMWIEHSDKGRVELNYLTFNALADGRSFTVYLDKTDRQLFNTFSEIINYENDFSSPFEEVDFRNTLVNKPNTRAPAKKKEIIEVLNNEILSKINTGNINNRNELIEYIKSKGILINRVRKDSISIKFHKEDVPLALKGDIYKEGRDYTVYKNLKKSNVNRDPEDIKILLHEFRRDFNDLLNKRQSKNNKRFAKKNSNLTEKTMLINCSESNTCKNKENIELENNFSNGGVTFVCHNIYYENNYDFKNEKGAHYEQSYNGGYQRKKKTEEERFEQLRERIRATKRIQQSVSDEFKKYYNQQFRTREKIRLNDFRIKFFRKYAFRFSLLFKEIIRRAFIFTKRAEAKKIREEKKRQEAKEKAKISKGGKFRV